MPRWPFGPRPLDPAHHQGHAGLIAALLVIAILIIALLGASACGAGESGAATANPAVSWVDQPVTFTADAMTIYATFRHPVGLSQHYPAALLIAGSGPTDRDGNSAVDPGPVDTLKTVADWLSADGVASLRYDKLGSGQTGLGSYAAAPDTIGIAPFEHEAAAGISFLAAQHGVDPARLAVVGHSEGALFALLLASGTGGSAPRVHALALLEPLSGRYLDVITAQVQASVTSAQKAGTITAAAASTIDNDLATATASLRATGTVPPGLPASLASVFNPSTALFLSQADRSDPATLGAGLPAHAPVLVSCSDSDLQVTCPEVDNLVSGLAKAPTDTTYLHLNGADHVLKQDPSGSASNYTKPLPFSPQLQAAIAAFVKQHL